MNVIILAGGLGTRLSGEVSDRPKCLAPINDHPFLEYLFNYLADPSFGVGKVILALGYMADAVTEWVDSARGRYPFEFAWSVETSPLGTGGAIRNAIALSDADSAIVMNGDTIFAIDIPSFAAQHAASGAALSVALRPMINFDRFGVVNTESDGRILSFSEKRPTASGNINGGTYMLDCGRLKPILDSYPEKFSFEKEILETKAHNALEGALYGYPFDSYFIDIGIPEDFHRAADELKNLFNNRE